MSQSGKLSVRSLLLASTAALCAPTALIAQQASDGDTVTLDTITLEGTYETESTDSYTTSRISVGDKDARSPREVPQSTTVLTRERLEDGNFTSLDTAMRRTPGVVVLTNDDGRSSIYSRGFEFDSLYLNGLPRPLSSIYGTQPDMAIVDHVEILRGPSGLYFGAGEPAGAINMRLKQPREELSYSTSVEVGSWNKRRAEVDVTGKLNESGTVRGRMVAAYGTQDSWVDTVDNETLVLYGTVAVDLTPDTTATFSINHQKRDITPFNGLPTTSTGELLDFSRSTYTGADWNDFNSTVNDYIVEVEHRFDDGGNLKFSALWSQTDVDMLYGYAGSAISDAGTVSGMRWLYRDYEQDALSLDAHLSKPLELFGVENTLIIGADYRKDDSTLYNGTGVISGTYTLSQLNSLARPSASYSTRADSKTEQSGIYAQWRIKPTAELTLIAGGRVSWYEASTTTTTLSTGAQSLSETEENGKFVPYLGAIYDLSDSVSAYASYTEIFQPQTQTDASGNILKPRTGRQYELGVKAELLDGLNVTAALFDLKDSNRAISDTANTGYYLAQGEAHMRGLELEATGNLGHGWEVVAGYTYTDTEFDNTNTAAGSEFYSPEHMLQLWGKYRFQQPGWNKVQIGAGIKAFSDFKNITRTATGGATTIEGSGYAVVDLMASYDVAENVTASLSINNLFDKSYYERVGGTSVFNFYGEPRSVTLKIAAKF